VWNRFRCLIGDTWWLGTIKAVQPHSADFPNSKFLLYKVLWDNNDHEVLSPWDIEVIPDAFGKEKEKGFDCNSKNSP